jgi:hypothetical protein
LLKTKFIQKHIINSGVRDSCCDTVKLAAILPAWWEAGRAELKKKVGVGVGVVVAVGGVVFVLVLSGGGSGGGGGSSGSGGGGGGGGGGTSVRTGASVLFRFGREKRGSAS